MLTAIAPALLFNYLMVCHIAETQFEDFMQTIMNLDLVLLAPCVIALTMIVTQWGLWSRTMYSVGMEELALSNPFEEDRVAPGRERLARIQKEEL